ncbi:hypothetical protein RDI58_028058 [Solanum bulbocastanum]|uniref:Uncharacterized protein n=1 Tax=Solanum bulbocastanum TaxID=147425 RepID=A0AAN8SPM3_SOLBU
MFIQLSQTQTRTGPISQINPKLTTNRSIVRSTTVVNRNSTQIIDFFFQILVQFNLKSRYLQIAFAL